MATNGIFSLEGEWDSDLRKRSSVLPVLQLLEGLGQVKYVHRDVATVSEVEHYLKVWRQTRYADYRLLYLASHGEKGTLFWSGRRRSSTLEDLVGLLDGAAQGRYIYFGSCLTLFDDRAAQDFAERTGAKAVLGYRRAVDWNESAGFEVIALPWLAGHGGSAATFYNSLMRRHHALAALLKFTIATSSGVQRSQDWPLTADE